MVKFGIEKKIEQVRNFSKAFFFDKSKKRSSLMNFSISVKIIHHFVRMKSFYYYKRNAKQTYKAFIQNSKRFLFIFV